MKQNNKTVAPTLKTTIGCDRRSKAEALILIIFFSLQGWGILFSQNNALILDGAYITHDGGTATTPIYMVVDQPSTLGIVRTANGGHIHSENQWNIVLWNAGTGTGNYVYPFGIAANPADYIPFTFNKTTAGSSNIATSTWATNQQNMPHPDTSNLPAVYIMDCQNMNSTGDSVTAVIDRFWDIKSSSAVTADVTFTYLGTENTTTNPTGTFKAEHWNGTTWDFPVGPGNAGVTTATGTVGPVTGQTTFSPWTLVNIPAPLIITGNTTICNGNTTTLVASGGSNYIWNPTGQTTTSIIVNPSATTTYTVIGTNVNGCIDDTSIIVNVSSSPTILISGTTTICVGQSATLTASGGGNYLWNTGATTAVISVTPTSSGTYSVIVYSGSCSDSTSVNVTVNPTPTVTVSAITTICSGQSATLTASGGTNYSWSNGATSTSIIISPTSNSNYTVTVTDANGCSDTTSANISVTSIAASISPSTTICAGQSVSLSASGGTIYSWSNGSSTSSINVNPSATTNYSVVVSNASGCSDTAIATITVSPPPTASVSGNNTICAGTSTTLSATGGSSFLWNTGQTTSSIVVSPASNITYSVIASVGNCSDTASLTVNVSAGPAANAGTDITINIGNSTTLIGSGGGTYSWSPSTGLSCSNCPSPVANPTVTTDYCLFVTDASGCEDSSCVTVYVEDNICKPIYLPNAFSPNADLENDVLYVYGTCIKEMKLIIYNRWGEKVYEGIAQTEGWNGIYNGNVENAAVFTYYLTYILTNGENGNKKGNVSLVR